MTLLAALLALIAGCDHEMQPPLAIADVSVLVPPAEGGAAVGYLTLVNGSDQVVTLHSVTSPQFGAISIHETTIVDNVARMRAKNDLQVPPDEKVHLETGGLHLMLLNPVANLPDNAPVTLEFHYDNSGLVIVETTAQIRRTP